MCPWVGPHAPSFGRQLWGAAQPCGVSLTTRGIAPACLRYDRLELRGHSAWQVTPSWTVYRLACHRLLPWLRVMFAMVPDAAWRGSDQWPWSTAPDHWPSGSAGSPQCVRPMGYWFFPDPRPPYVCAVSWAAGLLFTGVPVRFAVVRLRCPGPAGSCSPVCSLGVLCCMCGVLGHWAPVHRCACCVRCACAMGGCVPLPSPLIFVFFSLFFFFTCFFFFLGKKKKKTNKRKTGARVHCRHRHGQLVRRCNSVVSSGVCLRCCGGGRAPGVRLACPDVHGYGSGWVWLGVSLLLVLAG